MSINPEKLKQYIALKEVALKFRAASSIPITASDPKPDSRNAFVSVVLHCPFSAEGETKTALAALHTFSDAVYVSAGPYKEEYITRLTFAVENMQKEE